jgi:hypothetical protein
MCPPNGSLRRHPLPSAGSLGSVPPLRRHYEMPRRPPAPPAALRCLRLAVPPPRLRFTPDGPRRLAAGDLGVGKPVAPAGLETETGGPPKFLGNLDGHWPCSSTPAGPGTLVRSKSGVPGAAPALDNSEGSHIAWFRGSNAGSLTSLSTLRRGGCPTRRKTRFRLLDLALPGGIETRKIPTKGFRV